MKRVVLAIVASWVLTLPAAAATDLLTFDKIAEPCVPILESDPSESAWVRYINCIGMRMVGWIEIHHGLPDLVLLAKPTWLETDPIKCVEDESRRDAISQWARRSGSAVERMGYVESFRSGIFERTKKAAEAAGVASLPSVAGRLDDLDTKTLMFPTFLGATYVRQVMEMRDLSASVVRECKIRQRNPAAAHLIRLRDGDVKPVWPGDYLPGGDRAGVKLRFGDIDLDPYDASVTIHAGAAAKIVKLDQDQGKRTVDLELTLHHGKTDVFTGSSTITVDHRTEGRPVTSCTIGPGGWVHFEFDLEARRLEVQIEKGTGRCVGKTGFKKLVAGAPDAREPVVFRDGVLERRR